MCESIFQNVTMNGVGNLVFPIPYSLSVERDSSPIIS